VRSFAHCGPEKALSADIAPHTVSQEDPHMTVQAFVDLVKRHEQMFYNFVYKVHSRGGNLFDNLTKWIELFLTVVRDGIGDPTSVEFLLPHTGQDREAIMKEIDDVALYHYKLKLAHEDKLRKRFGRTQKRDDADAEDEATAALVQGVVNDISFGDLIDGDAEDLAAELSASEGSSDYSSSDEYDSDEDSDDDDSEESSVGGKPPPPPPKSPLPQQHRGSHGVGRKQNHVGPTPRTRATTMKNARSDAAVSSVSLDLGTAERLSITQRLRNSKSMEMLRKGKSTSSDLPPPPPLPQQHQPYQPYRPKRSATTHVTGRSPQPSVGSMRCPPPARRPPSPPNENPDIATPAVVTRARSKSVANTSGTSVTTSAEEPTWSSRTSLESDKNMPLPDPEAKVGLDPDRTPRMPQRDPDAVPKVGEKKPKLKKVVDQIKPPELTHIPKLLPIFVELVRRDTILLVLRFCLSPLVEL
jgi:hypothetical protein